MILNIDLLEIPGAEVIEHNGTEGIFIPKVPNYRFFPKKHRTDRTPPRAIMKAVMFNVKKKKYDWMGVMSVFPEYNEAYMSNPLLKGRRKYFLHGYKFLGESTGENVPASTSKDFEDLLGD